MFYFMLFGRILLSCEIIVLFLCSNFAKVNNITGLMETNSGAGIKKWVSLVIDKGPLNQIMVFSKIG